MARPLIPFVQNGYYASRNWIPLVKGNGFTTSGGGEQEEVWETASGSVVTFDAIAAPLRRLSVAVEPVQSGSGNPSPTNVRPITGFDSVNIWVQPTHDTTAEPTATIQLGEKVYGGTLDVVNGTMTVTWAKIVYNGSETWHPYGTQGYYISRNDMLKALNYKGKLKSDILPTYQSNYSDDFKAAKYGITGWSNLPSSNQNYIYVKCGEVSATDQTVIKAWLQENPLTVTYELATPFELTLTPEQISTVQGTNNVWSDAGDVTVEYRAQ